MTTDAESADVLYHVKPIATFMCMREKQAQHLIDRGIIPTFRLPGTTTTCARKSSLLAWLVEQEAKGAHRPKADAA